MNDAAIRLGLFFGILAIMLLWEQLDTFRQAPGNSRRRAVNLGFAVVNSLILRLALPAGLISVAVWAETQHIGVFHWLALPHWLAFVVGLILMDCLIYWQHRLFHRVPMLWRLHRMHHSDLAFDVTTALRFHPIEMLLSLLIKFAAVIALGLSPMTILVFEILLNGLAMFNHGNVRLPASIDRLLRRLIVTPDFHRVHHSLDVVESNRNFGFNLSIWDRLFGSYQAQPALGHDAMHIGLNDYPDTHARSLPSLMAIPLYPLAPDATAPERENTHD